MFPLLVSGEFSIIRCGIKNNAEQVVKKKRQSMSKSIKIPAEIYSRISGYYRPVNQWNRGKQEEFACRTSMKISSGAAFAPEELQSAIA